MQTGYKVCTSTYSCRARTWFKPTAVRTNASQHEQAQETTDTSTGTHK